MVLTNNLGVVQAKRPHQAETRHGKPRSNAKPSDMALAAALARAAHFRYDTPHVFEDTHAFDMLYGHWRWVVANPVLHRLVLRKLLGRLRGVHGEVVARSRYSEDSLRVAISRGMSQYVIVGAGLDTFALREPGLVRHLTLVELDQAVTQDAKKRRLIAKRGQLPAGVDYVAVDFEHESIGEALRRSRYRPAASAFFSWLGTTFYLDEATVFESLRAMRAAAAPGSEIVFDYCVTESSVAGEDREELRALKQLAKSRGEPFRSGFDPIHMAHCLEKMGFELVANVSPQELERRYFANRTDGFKPSRFAWIAHLRVPAAP